MFKLAEELIAAAEAGLGGTTAASTLTRFDIAQLARGISAVKATALLLEQSHAEFASGIARQIFEQLVNMEYLAAQPDRLAVATSYAKFGLMQQIAQRLKEIEYEEDTGRPNDRALRDQLRGFLAADFDEFKGKPKSDGGLNLKTSWSGKNVRQLASSSHNTMRPHQYNLLFAPWSTEVHAAPAAMTDDLFAKNIRTTSGVRQTDVEEAAQLLSSVLNLFLDLWKVLPNVVRPNLAESLDWLARMQSELAKVVDISNYQPPSRK